MTEFDLRKRSFAFAVDIGRLIMELPSNTVNQAYAKQLIKCSSSVGANYRAARRAKSDADFLNKLKIVEEEADESIYFLELLAEFNQQKQVQFTQLIAEATALLKITVASINTTRERINAGKK
jgi:four helix bundle protein